MLKIYNTLTRKIEEFKPMHDGKVKMFVCGPTVYDYPHLGHAKTYTQFDFICRYIRKKGFDVFYLMNITDIDDKIINRAKENKVSAKDLAHQYEKIFMEDMKSLHNTSVNEFAKATNHIPNIIKQITTLVDNGFAYEIKDGYYYDLKKFHDYGKLSGRTALQENDAVSRIDENTEKRNKGDFCLWKFYKEGEPYWDTELGKGRPGWHIEDTAITEHYFGVQYDLHGGAVDLIFPHHEAEIAQQEAASGKKPFVKYWMHTAFLNINSEKMSKSKGNFFTIRDALEHYTYATLRFFFLGNYYRMPIDFTPEVLEQARNGLKRVNDFIFNINADMNDEYFDGIVNDCRKNIFEALDDDLDTPKAFAILFDFIRDANTKALEGKTPGKRVYALMKELDELFDFMTFDFGSMDNVAENLLKDRIEAKKNKDFKKADELRDKLKSMGYQIDDTPQGAKIRKL